MNYSKQTKAQLINRLTAITEEQEATTVRYAIVFLAGMLTMYALIVG